MRIHWSWMLSMGVLESFLWSVYKPDIWICFPYKFVYVCGKGSVWVFIIDFFSWSKMSFKLFVQAFFCWFLTCVYNIYCISVHCSWNLSLVVLANFQWTVSNLEIFICFPCRFLEGRGKGNGFCYFICCRQYINWIQGSSLSFSSL